MLKENKDQRIQWKDIYKHPLILNENGKNIYSFQQIDLNS